MCGLFLKMGFGSPVYIFEGKPKGHSCHFRDHFVPGFCLTPIGVLFGCFGRRIDGDAWFTRWLNSSTRDIHLFPLLKGHHLPGTSIYVHPTKDTNLLPMLTPISFSGSIAAGTKRAGRSASGPRGAVGAVGDGAALPERARGAVAAGEGWQARRSSFFARDVSPETAGCPFFLTPFFGWEGSSTKIRQRRKKKWVPLF